MLALVEITGWHWAGFVACILVFLALDLGLFHRHAHTVSFKEALTWTAIWFVVAMLFDLGLRPLRGEKEALEFVTGQGRASISLIQRRFRIGFNRAARYIEQMEAGGLLGAADGSKPRVVLKGRD